MTVADGLFEGEGDGVRLIGSRCPACGTTYFPQARGCRNPACDHPAIGRVQLPRRGRLVSYTIQHYRPPPPFQMDDWQPYAIGLVDLGDGVEVMGMMTGVAIDSIAIGIDVRLVAEPLFHHPDGAAVMTYKFVPDTPA